MTIKKHLLILSLFVLFQSCGQEKMNDLLEYEIKKLDEIKVFNTQPVYALQLNKNLCRVLISCNNIPHWLTFYENYGESMLVPLNIYIPKSGKQLLTIQVFPKEGDKFIAENANADIRMIHMKDKDDSIQDFENLVELGLPENLGDLKLPYYEFTIPFDAVVPFDFSKELETAKDLSKVKNIEGLAVNKYNQLKEYIEEGKGKAFLDETKNFELRLISYNYFSKDEIIEDYKMGNSTTMNFFSPDIKNTKVSPIKDYEIVFGYNSKLITLRRFDNKDAILEIETEKKGKKEETSIYLTLFMPAGSNELKVW